VRPHRVALLFAALGCFAIGAIAPAAGCNGTGVTPMCDFPDGANNPESGCGELVEAAVPDGAEPDVVEEEAPPLDSSARADASDATVPVDAADAHEPDAGDSGDAHIGDAHSDAKG
jgi:hypothetical protein